jgi:hypothetical protein
MITERPGFIEADALYTLEELLGRMRWRRHAFRQAERSGLRVHKHGSRKYIYGRDVLAWFENQNTRKETNGSEKNQSEC